MRALRQIAGGSAAAALMLFGALAAVLIYPGAASARTTYAEAQFGRSGQAVAGMPDADATYFAQGRFPSTWRRRPSDHDRLVFGTSGGSSCHLRIALRASFTAGPSSTPEVFVEGLYPSLPPFLITRGSFAQTSPRNAVAHQWAWRYGLRRPVIDRQRALVIRWAEPVRTTPQTVWGVIAVDAAPIAGAGLCTTGFYRDGRLRDEMERVAMSLRLSADVV